MINLQMTSMPKRGRLVKDSNLLYIMCSKVLPVILVKDVY